MDSSLAHCKQTLNSASRTLNEHGAASPGEAARRPRPVPDLDIVQSLTSWIAAAQTALAAYDSYMDETLGLTLEKEESEALLEVVTLLRRDCVRHLFSANSTLSRISTDTHQGALPLQGGFDADYRKLLSKLEPYCRVQAELATNAWAGSKDPVRIRESIALLNHDSQGVRDAYLAFSQKAVVLLENVFELLVSS